MKKLTYILAVFSILLCGCMKETFLTGIDNNLQPICFGGESATLTKSVRTGNLAARDLGYSYIVTGYAVTSTDTALVFDHYKVNYVNGSAGSSNSNASGWEYVGQTPDSLSHASSQEIKYWDVSAKYIFVAFSKGEGNSRFTRVVNTTIDNGNNSPTADNSAFRIQGRITDIEGAYYSDLQVVNAGGEKPVVTPVFKHVGAKIRLAMYETIPGYSVTDVRFYQDDSTELAADGSECNPILYQSEAFFPAANATGVIYVAYPSIDSRTAVVSNPNVDSRTNYLSFAGGLEYVSKENKEQIDGNVYLGRSSATASYSSIAIDIPASAGTPLPIKMKVDYTLVPTDGAGERIYVHGSTVSVPASYTKWSANCMYTYIFKISDQTGGSTGGGVSGLYPISFDAVTMNDLSVDSRETVTTVTGPSITTYQKNMAITTNGENVYNDENLYIVIEERGSQTILEKGRNINLFTVQYNGYEPDQVTEALVSECFKSGDSSDDSFELFDKSDNSNHVLMTRANELLTDGLTSIPAQDSPNGKAIAVNCASFVPRPYMKYAIQYVDNNGDCTYKIINVGEAGIYYFINYTALPGDIYGRDYPMFGVGCEWGINENFKDNSDFGEANLDFETSMARSRQVFYGEGEDEYYIEGTLAFDNPVTSINNAMSYLTSLMTVDIPSSVTELIGDFGALCLNDNLTKVVLHEGLLCIGDYAFELCPSLTDIKIPASVTNMGDYSFTGCPNLQNFICQWTDPSEVEIPENLSYFICNIDVNQTDFFEEEAQFPENLLIFVPDGCKDAYYNAWFDQNKYPTENYPTENYPTDKVEYWRDKFYSILTEYSDAPANRIDHLRELYPEIFGAIK